MTRAELEDVVEKLCAVAHMHEDRIKTLEAALAARGRTRVNPPPKPCVMCGTEFSRRDDEPLKNYRKRKTCGPECRAALIARPKATVTPKPCRVCGDTIPRRQFEPPSVYAKRSTCSEGCAVRWRKRRQRDAYTARRRAQREASKAEAARRREEERARREQERARPAPPRDAIDAWTAAYRAISDYRGLPLTVDDVADLTGMGRERARKTCDLLVAGGLVASRRIEGNVTVWYDAAALRAAA